MTCPEWTRLMDRYCALVKTFSEAVLELKDSHGADLAERREHVDVLRAVAQQARIDWEEHERVHGCMAKGTPPEIAGKSSEPDENLKP